VAPVAATRRQSLLDEVENLNISYIGKEKKKIVYRGSKGNG
jgi:hypothetical protein